MSNTRINIDTRFLCLLGKPLGQSFAARMQNTAYDAAGLNLLYFYSEVENDHLGDVINGLRYMSFAGCAVTKPNKVEVMQYLDEVDPIAAQIGSCNTVVIKDGKLKGYNTDGLGAIKSLQKDAGVELEGKTCFSFGAGGTGRSVCLELAKAGAKKIYISSRSALCEELAAHINQFYPGVCEAIRVADQEKVKEAVADSDILLNLSGLGMRGHEDETPVDKSYFLPKHICFDATYNPGDPLFLREAEEMGVAQCINGLGMSLYQGAAQIELWSDGAEAPVDAMRQELMTIQAEKK